MYKNQCKILIIMLLLIKVPIFSQEFEYIEVKGEIIDELFSPIAFVNIISKRTGLGTISQESGKFYIKVLTTDTLVFSAIAFEKKEIPVSKLTSESNSIFLEKKIFQLGEVDIMGLRWQQFKQEMMEKEVKREDQLVLNIKGLPNPFQPKIELGPYAGNSNPVSLLLTYFKKENIRRRKIERWRKIYRKSYMGK